MAQDVAVSIVRDIKNLISWVTILEYSPWLAKLAETYSLLSRPSIYPEDIDFVDMYMLEQVAHLGRGKVELCVVFILCLLISRFLFNHLAMFS